MPSVISFLFGFCYTSSSKFPLQASSLGKEVVVPFIALGAGNAPAIGAGGGANFSYTLEWDYDVWVLCLPPLSNRVFLITAGFSKDFFASWNGNNSNNVVEPEPTHCCIPENSNPFVFSKILS
jgi:hypothetical protein